MSRRYTQTSQRMASLSQFPLESYVNGHKPENKEQTKNKEKSPKERKKVEEKITTTNIASNDK